MQHRTHIDETIIDLSQLEDGQQTSVWPEQLKDASFGNTRTVRDAVKDGMILESMRVQGIIQPVVARPIAGDPNNLELIAGYGRRDKARIINQELSGAGKPVRKIPVLVRKVNDDQAVAIQIAENTQRIDLTLMEESEAAQRYTTEFEGDRDAAAGQLGWSRKKLDERLELQKCSDKVKAQLKIELISAGHAIILAPFPQSIQDMQVDNIINNRVTVAQLKSIVKGVELPLDTARFDQTECQTCPHNTAPQIGLFNNIDDKARCAKKSCYTAKTQSWLEQEKQKASEKYGIILFLSETDKQSRSTVNQQVVGVEQFQQGCSSCRKFVTLMDDTTGNEGLLIESQCINKGCFNTKALAQQTSAPQNDTNQAKSSSSPTDASQSATTPKKGKTTVAKSTSTKVDNKPSRQVTDNHRDILRAASAAHFKSNKQFHYASMLCALASAANYHPKGMPVGTQGMFIEALGMPCERLQGHIMAAIEYLATKSEMFGGYKMTDIMIKALANDKDNAKAVALTAWQPTPENLKPYFVPGLVAIAEQSGIADAIESSEKRKWNKVKGNKAELLKAMSTSDADVSQFAPKEYLAHVTGR